MRGDKRRVRQRKREGNEFFLLNFNGGATGLSPPPLAAWCRSYKIERAAIHGYRYVAIIYFTDRRYLLRLFRLQDEN